MDIITYYRSRTQLINGINELIDKYWDKTISEQDLIDKLKLILKNNSDLIYTEGVINSTVKLRLGKRRLDLIDKISREV